MDMARIQPAEAGPTPSAGDLEAYDVILGNASRLTFRLVNAPPVCTTFRVDADGTKDAFSILVNHDRARPGENRANDEPFGAFRRGRRTRRWVRQPRRADHHVLGPE